MKRPGKPNGKSVACGADVLCEPRFAALEAAIEAAAGEDVLFRKATARSLGHIERLVRALARGAGMDPDKE